jgi:hypothetical protein
MGVLTHLGGHSAFGSPNQLPSSGIDFKLVSRLGTHASPALSELRELLVLTPLCPRPLGLSPNTLHPWHLQVSLALGILRQHQGMEAVGLRCGQRLGPGQASHPVLAVSEGRVGCPAELQ